NSTLLWQLRQRALSKAGAKGPEANKDLPEIIERAHSRFGRGLSELRPDFLALLANSEGPDELANGLSQVSATTRQRSGHLYFQAFLCLASAAGIVRVFTFLDQIEDLANPYVTTKKKRYQEVERFRDTLIED